ncbi:MAG: lysine 2,3-aminomutase, partial [bacterium]|nr:lysine 2,3-aminomutase [bacterium]
MVVNTNNGTPKYQAVTRDNIRKLPVWSHLEPELQEVVRVVSAVLPFRINNYVIDNLIDWDRVPDDPIYQLTFPQKGMLTDEQYRHMAGLLHRGAPSAEVTAAANQIRYTLSPHPAGQLTHNRPHLDGRRLDGMQHKYRETVLFFPSQGQTCHAYCTFCFRWAQFVGISGLKFASNDVDDLLSYLREHHEVTDVLFTGGDPMIMKASHLKRYIEPILDDPMLAHVVNIRIGTKAVAYWPQRFVTDPDADE